jgi:hypothetical protein
MKHAFFGYPHGHRLYQENLIIRFYPLAMTALFVIMVVSAVLRTLGLLNE